MVLAAPGHQHLGGEGSSFLNEGAYVTGIVTPL
jgi:hypothetical protein